LLQLWLQVLLLRLRHDWCLHQLLWHEPRLLLLLLLLMLLLLLLGIAVVAA
jgi:hypothetical protein